jgi:pilus assembly protein Flp/PilA
MDKLQHFAKDESAVTAIEYGLITAAIGLMLVAVTPLLRDPLAEIFRAIGSGFTQLTPS